MLALRERREKGVRVVVVEAGGRPAAVWDRHEHLVYSKGMLCCRHNRTGKVLGSRRNGGRKSEYGSEQGEQTYRQRGKGEGVFLFIFMYLCIFIMYWMMMEYNTRQGGKGLYKGMYMGRCMAGCRQVRR